MRAIDYDHRYTPHGTVVSSEEKSVICHALRVAAEMYRSDAVQCKEQPRLVEQFERQARDAETVLDELE